MRGHTGPRRTAVLTVLAAFLMPAFGVGVASAIELGETVMLKVPDLGEFPNPIEEHQFTCRAVTENAVWLVQDTCSVDGSGPGSLDSLVWGNIFDQAELDVMTSEFEGAGIDVWGTVTGAFGGTPVDTDGDPKVWVILATIRDAYVQDPKDPYIFVWVNPEDVDGSGLFNNHDCFYINLHNYTGSSGQLEVAKPNRLISIPNGLGELIRTILVPTEELWLIRGLGEIAQYETYGVTYTDPGYLGIQRNMEEFEKTPYLELPNYQASSWKYDYTASRGQEFLWLMYLRQRAGDDIIPDIVQNTDETMLGMDNIAYALNPASPDIQTDVVPIYKDWLVCNLYSELESTYGGGIYTYDFLLGDSLNFAHVGNSAAFQAKFDGGYPIGLWIAPEGAGLDGPIWASQYDYFYGDYTGNTTVAFNGMYSDGSGSGPAINGAWVGILVTVDSTSMDIASISEITLNSWFNGTFELANDASYLILTNNNEGGASDLRYVLAQGLASPAVNLTMYQGLVSEQYVTLFTALYNTTSFRTTGFDWVGPIFTATLGDSTSNQAMSLFYGDIWNLRFSAWDDGTYDLTSTGFDSSGVSQTVSRQLSVAHVVGGNALGLEVTGARFDVPGGAAAPGSMVILAESDLLGLAIASQATLEECGAMTGIVAGPVTISDVMGTLRFEAENGEAAIHRYDEQGWHRFESYYQDGYVCASVDEGGIYVLGDGPGISSPELPATLQFGGSFPNPFQSETMISFSLPSTGHVSLRVFDMSGRLVRTLADGDMTAANHAVSWDGRDHNGDLVGAGVYFCRLEAAGQISTQKMLRVE
jgi:hypothetical protein